MTQHPNDKAYTMGYKDGVKAEREWVNDRIKHIFNGYGGTLGFTDFSLRELLTQEDKIK